MAFQEPVRFNFTPNDSEAQVTFRNNIRFLRVTQCPFPIWIYEGYGTHTLIARLESGDQRTFQLANPVDQITLRAVSLPASPDSKVNSFELLGSADPMVDTGHTSHGVMLAEYDVEGMIVAQYRWGNFYSLANREASAGLVSVVGAVAIAHDVSYDVMIRPSAGAHLGSFALAAGVREAVATVWCPDTQVRISDVRVSLASSSAAAEVIADLVRINTAAPTGGTTCPVVARAFGATTTHEARYHPAAFAEVAGAYGFAAWRPGVTGALSTVNPVPPVEWVPLLGGNARDVGIEVLPGNGIAVVLESDAAATVRVGVRITMQEGL